MAAITANKSKAKLKKNLVLINSAPPVNLYRDVIYLLSFTQADKILARLRVRLDFVEIPDEPNVSISSMTLLVVRVSHRDRK